MLSKVAERFYTESGDEDFFRAAREVQEVGTRLLAKYNSVRRLKTNVEFYTAVLLHGIGIPRALFSTTFAISRAGGWMAHALEQKRKGWLVRPVSRYDGDRGRTWRPAANRERSVFVNK